MKKFMTFLLLISFLFVNCSNGLAAKKVNVIGKWEGEIDVSGQKLGIIINFKSPGSGLQGTIDIPAQGAKNVPLNNINISDNKIKFKVPQFPGNVKFEGEIKEKIIKGDFHQHGASFPFKIEKNDQKNNHKKAAGKEKSINYALGKYEIREKEVKIPVKGGELAGTLTVPEGIKSNKSVILVAGSGPTDRNGNTPLLPVKINTLKEIAHYLSSKGIITLRYDKRGVRESSNLIKKESPSFNSFRSDLMKAVDYIRKLNTIDKDQIYLAGHSEGALLSIMAAEQGAEVEGIILISGPGFTMAETLRKQINNIADHFEKEGNKEVKEEMITALDDLYQAIRHDQSFNIEDYDVPDQAKNIYLSFAYQRKFTKGYLDIDPVDLLQKVDEKVCIIQGTNDGRVETKAAKRLASVVPKKRLDLNIVKGVNHFLKKAKPGNLASDIRIDKKVLNTIYKFVK